MFHSVNMKCWGLYFVSVYILEVTLTLYPHSQSINHNKYVHSMKNTAEQFNLDNRRQYTH